MFSRLASQSNSLVTRSLIRQFHVSAMAPVAVGDKVVLRLLSSIINLDMTHLIKKNEFQVPDVTLFEDSPGGKVSLTSLCAGKKVIFEVNPPGFKTRYSEGCRVRSSRGLHPRLQQDSPPGLRRQGRGDQGQGGRGDRLRLRQRPFCYGGLGQGPGCSWKSELDILLYIL